MQDGPDQTGQATGIGNYKASADIPIEVVSHIFTYLSAEEARRLRLICGKWREAGNKAMFEDGKFIIRPHRQDTEHLEELSYSAWFVKKITHIEIYAGDMNVQRWEECIKQIEQNDINDYRSSLRGEYEFDNIFGEPTCQHILDHTYEKLETLELLKKKIYDHRFGLDRLSKAFSRLSNLNGISITPAVYPLVGTRWKCLVESWQHGIGRRVCGWPPKRDFQHAGAAFRRQTVTLKAAHAAGCLLQSLAIDWMPIECFPRDPEPRPKNPGSHVPPIDRSDYNRIIALVTPLKSLRIGLIGNIKCSPYTDPGVGAAISQFLGSMQNLRSLDLTWYLGGCVSPIVNVSWDSTFYNLTWPNLEDLSLSHVNSRLADLLTLLYRHSPTLKRLRLLYQKIKGVGSYQDMLTGIRDNLQLKKFQLSTPGLHSAYQDSLYDENWVENLSIKDTPMKHLEGFVLGNREWPLASPCPIGKHWPFRDKRLHELWAQKYHII